MSKNGIVKSEKKLVLNQVTMRVLDAARAESVGPGVACQHNSQQSRQTACDQIR